MRAYWRSGLVLAIAALLYVFAPEERPTGALEGVPTRDGSAIVEVLRGERADAPVDGEGRVERVLSDDEEGSRHQRFILVLPSGQTILVAHNIDLAARIEGLRVGDEVRFRGDYEWNERGGVVHWTHRDPAGRHRGGWLEHAGRRYE